MCRSAVYVSARKNRKKTGRQAKSLPCNTKGVRVLIPLADASGHRKVTPVAVLLACHPRRTLTIYTGRQAKSRPYNTKGVRVLVPLADSSGHRKVTPVAALLACQPRRTLN